MGGEPYWYFVKYQADLQAALDALRNVEFEAGRYNPVIPFLSEHFPIGPNSPAPGRQHDSIEEALEDSDATERVRFSISITFPRSRNSVR